jgi:ATP phosphoribosyltransferase
VSELVWALPKGRVLEEALPLLAAAGLDTREAVDPGRRLVVSLGEGHRGLLLKPWDVPTYVELGVAQLGIAGADVLRERAPDVYEPVDLRLGACRLAVAAPRGYTGPPERRPLRVASKYAESARRHFAGKGEQVDVIKLYGSVELAAVTGLADVVVDVVSSGATLRDNDLEEIETLFEVTSRLIVNCVAFRLHAAPIREICRRIEEALP